MSRFINQTPTTATTTNSLGSTLPLIPQVFAYSALNPLRYLINFQTANHLQSTDNSRFPLCSFCPLNPFQQFKILLGLNSVSSTFYPATSSPEPTTSTQTTELKIFMSNHFTQGPKWSIPVIHYHIT